MTNKEPKWLSKVQDSPGGRTKRTRSEELLPRVSEVTVAIDGEDITLDVYEEIRLDQGSDLNDMISTHHERFFFWRRTLASAVASRRKCERHLDRVRAALDVQSRSKHEGGTTEAAVKSRIHMSPVYIDATQAMDAALQFEDTVRAVVEAFEHRKVVIMKTTRQLME